MSFTTPTISYLDAYWILSGPKCLPSGFSFLKNRRAKASLITATGRVVGGSSSGNDKGEVGISMRIRWMIWWRLWAGRGGAHEWRTADPSLALGMTIRRG